MIEAIITLLVLVLSLTPVMMVQLNGVRATSRYARIFERIQYAITGMNDMFMHSLQDNKEKKSEEKTMRRPKTTLVVTQEKPSKDSALSLFRSLELIRAVVRWRDEDNRERSDTLITYRYQPNGGGA